MLLDELPTEIFRTITYYLSQEDKINLCYVSTKIYISILPFIYANLYLNERYYFPSDYDNSLGTHFWSVLYFDYHTKVPKMIAANDSDTIQKRLARYKFSLLVRSLDENPHKLCPLIKNVHCTWHLDESLMYHFIQLINSYANNLTCFENFIRKEITYELVKHAKTLNTLTITPPSLLPLDGTAPIEYFQQVRLLLPNYNFQLIQHLDIHVNALTFFKELNEPLKIKSLVLNLRPDTYRDDNLQSINYYDIFDVNALKSLEILSWYNTSDIDLDIYTMWSLRHFLHFHQIENLSILSLFANDAFIKDCIMNFNHLKRLKVDFMFDIPLGKSVTDMMGIAPCSRTLEYLDVKFEELNTPLIYIDQDEESTFQISLTCQCGNCEQTLFDVIHKKYFPNAESFLIKEFKDVESHNFVLQMFKLYPIVPYAHYFDKYPSIGWYSKPITEHAENVNFLLDNPGITEGDVVAVYHMYIHSLKKSFDYFNNKFPRLKYLIFNDLPTVIESFEGHQRGNIPLFHHQGYKSNQVYEVVDYESLFD